MKQATDNLEISAEIGHQWLLNLRDQCAQVAAAGGATSFDLGFPMIAIPHFEIICEESISAPKNAVHSIATNLEANPGDVHANMTVTSISDLEHDSLKDSLSDSLSDSLKDQEARFATACRPGDGRAERSEQGQNDPQPKSAPQRISDALPAETEIAVDGMIGSILERFPLAAPTVLLFIGSENNSHADTTSRLVAEALAGCNIGNVLLVDSNREGSLTDQLGFTGEHGVTNLMQGREPWRTLVSSQRSAGLDFLPIGSEGWDRWGGAQRLRAAVAEMKQHFQFICVSAGDAHLPNAKLWSGVCDGSYLLVSLTGSNQTIAESAVAELQSCGARLLGCVVTDAA